ncbi:MAG TPA: single-stranded DNA-binding protein [Coriobacteriia bacterium]
MSINRVCISGNLTRDPEMRSTGSGMAIMQLRMAVNDRRKNPQSGEWEDAPNYIGVVVFGQRAESLSRFLSKGSKIIVDGKLRWSEWDDKNTGEKRSKLEVVADDIDFGSSRSEGSGGGNYSAPSAPAASADPVFEDDIPF